MKNEPDTLFIAWTTCETEEIAKRLAKEAVESRLAACVQVSGSIDSFYRWEGEVSNDEEYRIVFKFHSSKLEALSSWIQLNHPYDNPQWYAVKADSVAPEYADWVKSCM